MIVWLFLSVMEKIIATAMEMGGDLFKRPYNVGRTMHGQWMDNERTMDWWRTMVGQRMEDERTYYERTMDGQEMDDGRMTKGASWGWVIG